jgi:hypothetical protein
MIRNNKKFLRSGNDPTPKNKSVRPTQDKIIQIIKENPNCTIADIYKEFPDMDTASIRKIMRRMIESHRVIQRFTVGNVPL